MREARRCAPPAPPHSSPAAAAAAAAARPPGRPPQGGVGDLSAAPPSGAAAARAFGFAPAASSHRALPPGRRTCAEHAGNRQQRHQRGHAPGARHRARPGAARRAAACALLAAAPWPRQPGSAENAKSHGSRLRRGAALPSNPRARWVTEGRQRPLPQNPGSKPFFLAGKSSRRSAFSAAWAISSGRRAAWIDGCFEGSTAPAGAHLRVLTRCAHAHFAL